jgi:hypothetical protein
MKLSIFTTKDKQNFQRVEIDVNEFHERLLTVRGKKGNAKMNLVSESNLSLYDLKIGDLLHVFIFKDEMGTFYEMPYVKDSFMDLKIPLEMEKQVDVIRESFKLKQERISQLIDHMIEHGSQKSSEKYKLLSDAFLLVLQDPTYFQELQAIVGNEGEYRES